ncbi:Kinetochore protein Spc25 [Seminavis robusta]|uniref:Kinetochore protein SPC25 n=1 Tax=Seminavis robusta TaxID=568900 RepID=A0A9N8DAU4_9STRA|nr:Kinetochore protein Spc25 [Seminavis robusta]|eukprot:Sro4_g002990.1 Kinetochore protein Spc25 (236) ;mRNA; f:23978-24892
MGHLGFTQGLLSKIVDCNTAVDQWVEREKRAADEMEANFRRSLAAEQAAIDAKEEELLSVKFRLGVDINKDDARGIAQQQQQLQQEKIRIQESIANLRSDRDKKEDRVKSLQTEAKREEARASDVRSRKQAAEDSKNTTVDDLTRGIINYKFLGLDFEKADNQKLRFSFTQIDPENPSRKCWFVLGANDYDEYDVDECKPSIDKSVLNGLLHDLNSDDDLQQFVISMRKAFADGL